MADHERTERCRRIREVLQQLGASVTFSQARDYLAGEGITLRHANFYPHYHTVYGQSRTEYLKRQSREVMPNGHAAVQGRASSRLGGDQPTCVDAGGVGEGRPSTAEPPGPNPTAPPVFESDDLDELLVVREFCRQHGGVERTSILVNTLKVLQRNPTANILGTKKEQPK